VLAKRFTAIWFMMKDKNVPKRKKLLVILGIIYVVNPIDLIPAVVFPLAFIDDFVVWFWIIWHLKDTLDTYWLGEKVVDLSKNYKGKQIINDVDFEVKKDPEE
jgi:uncharacterized membrane protein YkvA (DUF1232 family)